MIELVELSDLILPLSDSWQQNWVYSEHPGKEFGKFVTSAGGFYNDAENDKGEGATPEATPKIHWKRFPGVSRDFPVALFLCFRIIVILTWAGLNVLCGTSDSPPLEVSFLQCQLGLCLLANVIHLYLFKCSLSCSAS